MATEHAFEGTIVWTGNRGEGTRHYRAYDRSWTINTPGKLPVDCSNDPMLGGDPSKHNPEDLLLDSLAACHMLWYLHLASQAGVNVLSYADSPIGIGETLPNGAGRFLRATLRPRIELDAGSDPALADTLHHEVHKYCFIARSVAFPISYEATYSTAATVSGA
jgi:organic hydroperoxide reductase OsmC/OhrA